MQFCVSIWLITDKRFPVDGTAVEAQRLKNKAVKAVGAGRGSPYFSPGKQMRAQLSEFSPFKLILKGGYDIIQVISSD